MPAKRPRKHLAQRWEDVASAAQEHRDMSLRSVVGHEDFIVMADGASPGNGSVVEIPPGLKYLLSSSALAITDTRVGELVRLLAIGDISAADTITAFLRRSVVAQGTVNCITELLGTRALMRAKEIDRIYLETSRPTGPLHGIPISVKSHIGVKDTHMPAGYIAWWGNISARDALVVQILERAGAIIHARTTEPQSMMQLECHSNLYGRTLNPHNTHLSSGGSSGGEAALIAMRGSAIGVGSDVGGSIRVPAAACGIFGLKPTGFRVPTTGWSSTPPGADPIPTALGPMSGSLEGVDLFMSVVLAAEPWKFEPALVPLPWRSTELNPNSQRPIRIGVALHDGTVLPHPPITRALRELSEKISSLEGFVVVEFPLYKLDEAWAIASSLYFTDGGTADLEVMAQPGEPILPLTEWIIKQTPGVKNLTREELEYWLEEREEYRLEYSDVWNKTGEWDEKEGKWTNTVDMLICPVAPGVATRHGTAKYWSYSAVWNLLDYPALAFPAGEVDKTKDVAMKRPKFMSDHDRYNWSLYDAEVFDKVPIGLQAVGRRFDDERIVGIMKVLQDRGCLS